MNSIEKVTATLEGAEQLLERPELAPQARIALSTMLLARDHITGLLPVDPAELDQLLDRGSEWFQSLRSDPPAAPAPITGQTTFSDHAA